MISSKTFGSAGLRSKARCAATVASSTILCYDGAFGDLFKEPWLADLYGSCINKAARIVFNLASTFCSQDNRARICSSIQHSSLSGRWVDTHQKKRLSLLTILYKALHRRKITQDNGRIP